MKTPHLLAYALSTPWALMPERMAAYAAVLASHYAGELPPRAERSAESAAATPGRSSTSRSGNIAVVPVFGAMVEWASDIDICEGGTSSRSVSELLGTAEQDETVSQVLMVFNTPGGSVYGISELADAINRVKASKPVIGVAQSLAASAGYWALSQCTEAYCAPGGEVGSIGVYSGYQNIKKALEIAGVDIRLFSAGKYKTELSPFGDGLSEEAVAYQEQRAMDYYAMFTKAVSKGRGVPIDAVRNGFGEGRVLGADAALAAKMVDGVMTMEQVVKKMQRGVHSSKGRSASSALQVGVIGAAAKSGTAAGRFEVGDRVTAMVDHMDGMKGMQGTVVQVENGPYYAISFDEKSGDMKDPHKWLADDELEPAGTSEEGMKKQGRSALAAARNELDMLA